MLRSSQQRSTDTLPGKTLANARHSPSWSAILPHAITFTRPEHKLHNVLMCWMLDTPNAFMDTHGLAKRPPTWKFLGPPSIIDCSNMSDSNLTLAEGVDRLNTSPREEADPHNKMFRTRRSSYGKSAGTFDCVDCAENECNARFVASNVTRPTTSVSICTKVWHSSK